MDRIISLKVAGNRSMEIAGTKIGDQGIVTAYIGGI
jgi:hypothetical protein